MHPTLALLAAATAALAPLPVAADTVSDWIEFANTIQNPSTGTVRNSPRPM